MRQQRLAVDLDHFAARVLTDALQQATGDYWLRRSDAFEDAAPRPGDFHGQASQAELDERFHRCMWAAAHCRAHAELLLDDEPNIPPDVWAVLGESAA